MRSIYNAFYFFLHNVRSLGDSTTPFAAVIMSTKTNGSMGGPQAAALEASTKSNTYIK